ncbi:hypothetical protein [Streptomyces sp. NBC_01789]|uniref:hypothetical protein n=1 Tax=Streptomyces sp. NBC_01789 TaxID=2975941 RepID=UPI0022583E34|nr:hypothetical protein [Streptomyces sp. NBC_01789]MCX4451459.1 hypothetical protein [Streptomyces sp. NBC_01789]
MGLDITTLIADWSWLAEVPPRERLPRLRDAWYDDGTGLWDHDAPGTDGGWEWPRGPHGARFGVYEFPGTLGSFKPHFWAGEGWEKTRAHVDPAVRAQVDALLGGLTWDGPDFDDEESEDHAFFSHDHDSVLVACAPERVRELLATWERVRPRLDEVRAPFDEHAALPEGWIPDADAFVRLLTGWGEVLAEAARRGRGIAGLSG